MTSSTSRTWGASSYADFSIISLRMIAPSPAHAKRRSVCRKDLKVGRALAVEPREAFEPGEIHARRECRSDRDRRDPEQPLADTHLIPGVAARFEPQAHCKRERRRSRA